MDHHHQGSSTDDEDYFEDDATIAGPTKRKASKRVGNNGAAVGSTSKNAQKPVEVEIISGPTNGKLTQVNEKLAATKSKSSPRNIELDAGKVGNLNRSQPSREQIKENQRFVDAIEAQDAALKYWNMVNLPFSVHWNNRLAKPNAQPDVVPVSSALKNSLEQQRAAFEQKDSHCFPTPEMLAAQKQQQKLHEDESNHRHQSRTKAFVKEAQVPAPNFNGDLRNHAQVRRRARIYGQSGFDDYRGDEYEVISPDPEYHIRQNRQLRINSICSEIRSARKHRKKMHSDSERIQREKERLDHEFAERVQRHLSINSPGYIDPPPPRAYFSPRGRTTSLLDPVPPLTRNIPKLTLNTARYTNPSDVRDGSPYITPRDATSGRRSPFFTTAANQRNQVSFNLPANNQQLLSTIKQNFPLLLGLANQVLQNPDKSRLVENFLHALQKRVELMQQKLRRLEQASKNAMGERRSKLIIDMGATSKELKEYIRKIDDIRVLYESPECQSHNHHGVKNQGHGTGQVSALNQIRLLHHVFER